MGLPDHSGATTDTTRQEQPLPRNVKVLSAVSFSQDAGSEMLYPLLPTFITGVLGAPVVALGVAEGLADAVSAVMKLVAGRLAGAQRRRPWITAGYGLAALGKVIVAIAFVWPVVVVGRVVDRLGKGIRGVPRDALIADSTPDGQRGRAFGFHRSFDTLGAVVGPLIGLALYHALGQRIRPALIVAVVPGLISVALVRLVREAPSPTVHRVEPLARAPLPSGYWRVLVPMTLFALVNSTDALLLQRAHELGLGVTPVVLAYVSFNVVYAGFGYPAGRLADRAPHRYIIAAGWCVFAVVYVGLGTTTSSAMVWVLLPVYGLFAALTDGVGRAWIVELVPANTRTWALGVHGASTGLGVLLAGLWSGLLWRGDGRLPLTVSGIIALGAAAVLLLSTQVGLAARLDVGSQPTAPGS